MNEYHKIDSVYKRDEHGKFIIGEYSRPEFEYLKDSPWVWTEKVDGTNIRVMWDGYRIKFGGKTDNAQMPTKLMTHLQDTFNDNMMAEVFGTTDACLYGEGYGAGIQKGGGNYSPDQRFILFDIKIGNFWLERQNIEEIARRLGIPVVSITSTTSLEAMVHAVQTLAAQNNLTTSMISNTAKAEGFVGTPRVPLFNRKGERIITKVKYKDFM